MFNKFMDFCFKLDRETPGMGMAVFILVFAPLVGGLIIMLTIGGYKLSGAEDRYNQKLLECEKKGGAMLIIPRANDVCIKGGIVELESAKQ